MRRIRLLSLAALPIAFAQCAPSACAPPTPAPFSPAAPSSNCNPNYSPCVPGDRGDVDCPDLDGPVTVTGEDVYRLDRDGDGVGCETD